MTNSYGLHFVKMDLHVHTPASKDYRDKGITPHDLVQCALAQDLGAIAITDHQTAAMVDELKKAASGTKLVIFPGVELMVAGGERGIHINIIFDIDKDNNHITQFLNTLRVYSKDGVPTIAAEHTVGQVADELAKYDPSAIITLAHCHSSKGVTGDIKGETRTQIFKEHRKNLLGAEANESNFLNETLRKSHARVIDLFDGTDKDYNFKRMGVYQASDAHDLKGVGKDCSWFKVDAPISIEDLRQCLIDRDTRIRQPYEYKPISYPIIESLAVSSGFLQGQKFEFHHGLNSLLGAKGSGKSLVIEILRFVLNQSPQLTLIKEDHFGKLEKCVKAYGVVKAVIIDESGKRYEITRSYKPSEGSPIEIIDCIDGTKKDFSLAEVFPVLFLSQNEIIKIAEDQTGSSLRRFIDRFFDFHHHQYAIEQITKELSEIDKKVSEALRAHFALSDSNKKLNTLKEEIERLNRQLKNETFEKYTKSETVGREIRVHDEFVIQLNGGLSLLEQKYLDTQYPYVLDDADASVKRAGEVSKKSLELVREELGKVKEKIVALKTEVGDEYSQWLQQFAPIKAEYEKLVQESGGSQGVLNQKRKKLLLEHDELNKRVGILTSKSQGLRLLTEERNGVLDKLEEAHKKYFEERSSRCHFFSDQSNGTIMVTVAAGSDASQFKAKLVEIKKGSYAKDEDIDQLVAIVTPRELVSTALRFEFRNRQEEKILNDFAVSKGLRLDLVKRLIIHILDTAEYEELLSIMYETAPQDVPVISYNVNGQLKPLGELSVGQKAAALLIIGLSDGRFPIVIDQPEDSLDLRSIWDDVCSKLRESKERRQFIFTTHNSSVAVASDSDKFTILEAKATSAKILFSGSMNASKIKSEVIAYLEGGQETYQKKREKYNL